MYKLKIIDFKLPDLGQSVELRELTADQFFDANAEAAEAARTRGSQYVWLSKMLWVDGQQFSAEEIRGWGATVTLPLLTRLDELFPQTFMEELGNSDTEEEVPQDPNG
jgi:hypothetical protein